MLHATVVVAIELEKYISTFESLLGKYDSTVADQIHKDPQVADLMLQAMEGEQNLMIFWKLNHGGLFSVIGQSRKAMRYTIGNPRIALQMTRHDVRAALYVPFNILVIENDFSIAASRHGQLRAFSVEKLVSCAQTILQMNHSVAENQGINTRSGIHREIERGDRGKPLVLRVVKIPAL